MNPVAPSGDLIGQARTGDHRAFTALVRECDERMRRLAHRLLGDAAAMDDALQDAYLKAYRGLDGFSGDSAFSTWLYSIVYRTCLDHLRARSRRREVDLDPVEPTLVSGGDHAAQTADADALASALADLPPDQVAVVLLVDGDRLSYAEAARILDVREGTIASRLNRAHRALRDVLDREGSSS